MSNEVNFITREITKYKIAFSDTTEKASLKFQKLRDRENRAKKSYEVERKNFEPKTLNKEIFNVSRILKNY